MNNSRRNESYIDPPKRAPVVPINESAKKDENEIQQMVETLKQNILRDLQEVSKRYVESSG